MPSKHTTKKPEMGEEKPSEEQEISGDAAQKMSGKEDLTRPAEFSSFERWLCIIGWIVASSYSVLNVYWVSHDPERKFNELSFVPGWSWLGEKKDVSNYEWDFWGMWFPSLLPWMVAHTLLWTFVHYFTPQYRRGIYISFALTMLCVIMGWRLVLLLLVHIVLMYAAASFGHIGLTWLMCFALLTTLNFEPFPTWMQQLCIDDRHKKLYFLFLFSIAMTNMRYTAFGVEWCLHVQAKAAKQQEALNPDYKHARDRREAKKKQSDAVELQFGPLDMLLYCLYAPLYFYGPVMTYDEFYLQFHGPEIPWTKDRVKRLTLEFLRVCFWVVACEWVLHHVYFNAIQHEIETIVTMPLWAVAGTGYSLGQFFMMKYVVFYSMPGVFASLDGLSPPTQPKCISRVYKYSQMWKFFDKGLHNFLKRYMYIPIGGSRYGLSRQILATAASFGFVFYWHGAEDYLFIWVLLNFTTIMIESLSARFANNPTVRYYESKVYGPRMRRRLHGILAVPLFATSTLAIFTFLGGKFFGYVCYYRLVIEGSLMIFLLDTLLANMFLFTSLKIKHIPLMLAAVQKKILSINIIPADALLTFVARASAGFPVSLFTVWAGMYCCVQTSIEAEVWEKDREKKIKTA